MHRETSLDETLYSFAGDCEQCGAHHDRPDAVCSCGALLVDGLNPGAIICRRYKYIATIGNGGMGLIVKAYDPVRDCDVALKMLLRNNNPAEVARFLQECTATACLSHPSIIKIIESGVTEDGYAFMAMEYLPGEDLGTRISRHGALEFAEALEIFSQICDTMSYAHGKGVVHRDLKPSNIMLQPPVDGRQKIKIVDFGLAKLVYADGTSVQTELTRTGQIIGSPLYMSPEQALGKKIDFRTDIYSAACVLYHALTGAPPIHGESAIETLYKHVHEVPPPMSEASLGKKFPPALEDLVAKALMKDPAQRHQSFEELKQSLIEAMEPRAGSKSPGKVAGKRMPEKVFLRSNLALFAILPVIVGIAAASFFWLKSAKDPATSQRTRPHVHAASSEIAAAPDLDDHAADPGSILSDQYFSDGIRSPVDWALESKAPIIDLSQRGTGDGVIEYLVRRLKESHAPVSAVRLNESAVTDRGLKLLADAHISLLQLSLKDTKITSAGLQSVAKIRTLEKLELNNDHGIDSSSLKYLGELKRLKSLDLANVVHEPSKEEDFAFISDLKALKLLNLDSSEGLPPRIFKYAEGLSGLDSMSCRYSGLTDQSLQDIGRIKSLRELDIWDGTFTDKGIEKLAGLTGLKKLDCGGRRLTTAAFPVFVHLPNLTDLIIRKAIRISETDLDALRKEMPNCRIIKLKE